MKKILIVHDIGYRDIDLMLEHIDYVAQRDKAFQGDFTLYVDKESALVPILKEAGLPVEAVTDIDIKPDVTIGFVKQDGYAYNEVIKQWTIKMPVYPRRVN